VRPKQEAAHGGELYNENSMPMEEEQDDPDSRQHLTVPMSEMSLTCGADECAGSQESAIEGS
jgi:hypothetical protein